MFSIYPLRGTNKPVRTHVLLSLSYLSTTGDEQTLFRFLFLCKDVFIPYGGRINMKIRAFVRNKSIYPLRGTNKLFHLFSPTVWEHLSPTGDEQTSKNRCGVTLSWFIPCGGRTNGRCNVDYHTPHIYPLRGTNKPHNPGNQCWKRDLSPTGDEQTYNRTFNVMLHRFKIGRASCRERV